MGVLFWSFRCDCLLHRRPHQRADLELARGADEIRNGNLHPRINVNRSDELGMLAESFTRMAERLRETTCRRCLCLKLRIQSEVKRRTCQIRAGIRLYLGPQLAHRSQHEVIDAADPTVMLDQALALVEA